ncbi:hypothetical protein AAE478_001230 [Parahypoxylon ruwenzoriense]
MGNKVHFMAAVLAGMKAIFLAHAVPPAGHDTPLCSATSEAMNTFTVQNIKYDLRNPPLVGRLQLDVTNRATNVTTRCDIAGPQLTPGHYGEDNTEDLWTSCDNRPETPEGGERYYTIDTDVLFDRDSTQLVINQTWYCDEVNPEYPIAFKGTAETMLGNLTCVTSPPDQFLEECTASTITLPIYQYWRDDLPPDALEKPIPPGTPKPS